MEEVIQFLKECGTYYLATVEGDQPRVRPFGTAHVFEGKLYIQTGKGKPVSDQMTANPKIEICAFQKGQWLRIQAVAVEDDRVEARKSMLDAYPNLRKMSDPGVLPEGRGGNLLLFYRAFPDCNLLSPARKPRACRLRQARGSVSIQ